MKLRAFLPALILLATSVSAPSRSLAAETPALHKVRMAFTSLSSVMCPPWIARGAGIFNKHGLDVEVIATLNGVEGMHELIAGEVQFLQISGGTTASAALGGADVIDCRNDPRFARPTLMAPPEIDKPSSSRPRI
ncbi:MAG TPA: hypothetical protein VGH22_14165 [Candidatus Binatia bacterium]